jgi:lactate permease
LKSDGSPLVIKPFEFNYLSAPGTAVLLATIISIPLVGLKYSDGIRIFWLTLKQLRFPVITIASVVGFAFIANNSGMSISMAMALASTGILFPFFSPVLGWLGVFLTGSDTSSNALFGKLQASTAETLGIDPVVTVSANASGGVTGKMISPQSIAIGAAAVGLVGKESELFRFTVKHSFIMLFIISIITTIQAYITPWIIPAYEKTGSVAMQEVVDVSTGFLYLTMLAVALGLVVVLVLFMNKKTRIGSTQ